MENEYFEEKNKLQWLYFRFDPRHGNSGFDICVADEVKVVEGVYIICFHKGSRSERRI